MGEIGSGDRVIRIRPSALDGASRGNGIATASTESGRETGRNARADPLVDRLFSIARAFVRAGYFSFEVEGVDRVPRTGRAVYVQNHAGWFPLDAFFLALTLVEARGLGRAPVFATHDAALSMPVLGPFLRRFGAVPASWFRRPERLPAEIESCAIFPEGVHGNCKPFWEAYRMREWNRGFARVAIARRSPIVPVAILGGEECLPVAWTVKALRPLVGSILGMPLSIVPLPTRWKLVFHEPIDLGAPSEAAGDAGYCAEVARHVQGVVQRTLDEEASRRGLGRLSSFVAAATGAAAPPGEIEDPLDDPPFPPRPPATAGCTAGCPG
jgi:1-acyl-sn-glycerol-3-phosphate acyltransferase